MCVCVCLCVRVFSCVLRVCVCVYFSVRMWCILSFDGPGKQNPVKMMVMGIKFHQKGGLAGQGKPNCYGEGLGSVLGWSWAAFGSLCAPQIDVHGFGFDFEASLGDQSDQNRSNIEARYIKLSISFRIDV